MANDLLTQGAEDAAAALLNLYTSGVTRIGVGDSAAAFSVAQTGLQGVNTAYVAVDSATNSPANRLTYTATFGALVANFYWREVVVDRTTRTLVRKVQNIAEKSSGQEWQITIHIDFTPGT